MDAPEGQTIGDKEYQQLLNLMMSAPRGDPRLLEMVRKFRSANGNGIFAEEYKTPPDAIITDGPLMAKSRRGAFGESWWGQQWVAAMDRNDPDGRLERGRTYARNGAVRRLEISHGLVYAEVQGSSYYPYTTKIRLKPFSDIVWEKAMQALSDQAIYAAKLLAGEMPSDIESIFQSVELSLFPQERREISFECSCPDDGYPCKHAAAVYYLMAEQLDSDPFLLFHLRGRSREQVLSVLGGNTTKPAAAVILPTQLDSPESLANYYALVAPLPKLMQPGALVPSAVMSAGDPPGEMTDSLWEAYRTISRLAREQMELGFEHGGIALEGSNGDEDREDD